MKLSPSIELDVVQASDAQVMAELRVEAMKESLEAVGRFDPERAKQRFLSTFDAQFSHHITSQGVRIGFVVVRPIEPGLLLDHLYARPISQGSGVGSQVLKWVFEMADAQRKAVRVGALARSRSNLFYLRHGFILVQTTEFDNYYERPANTQPAKP
jgi:GNAT superfamily N-acetyltransferase